MVAERADRVGAALAAEAQLHRDAVADLPFGDARPDLGDDAGRIDARRQRQGHAPRVLAGAHHRIERAVDRNGVDLDQHLARARLRRRDLFELHHARRAELADQMAFNGTLPAHFRDHARRDKAAPCRTGQAPPRYFASIFGQQIGLLEDPRHQRRIVTDELHQSLRRAERRSVGIVAEQVQPPHHLGRVQHLPHVGVDLADDRRRRALRRQQRRPAGNRITRNGLADGRNVRIIRQALGHRDAEHAKVAGLALRNDLRAAEDHVDGAGDDVLQCARIAVVGHVDHLDVRRLQKIFARQMRDAARRGGGERKLAGLPARELDQLRDVLDRQLCRRRQHQRPIGREDDRLEVALDVIGHRFERVRRERQRRALREQKRITVRRRLRDVHRAGDATGARAVLDDDLLAPALGQTLGR